VRVTYGGLLGAALFGLMAPCMAVAGSSGKETPDRAPSIGREHAPIILRERHGSNATTSSNWSGYAVTGATDSVSDVKGSWQVPAIQGTCPSAGIQYSSFWVGIDGYNTNTVEQIGTDSDCVNGSPQYYAWYEFYPHYPVNIPLTIHVGDIISAEVKYSGGKFTVSLMDCPQGTSPCASWSQTEKMPNAKRASAEWIIEASGGQPLANFGTVNFGSLTNPCSATVGGATAQIGSPAFTASLVEITMVASNGNVMSQPSALMPLDSMTKDGFADAWQYAGP
jgi:hypothetical protein